MSISKDKQNLNQASFRPGYGSDKHGIQYSCGHINPLQKALVNNGIAKLNSIKESLKQAITDIENFSSEILDFAEVRCEDVRSINRELRDAIDYCVCNCEIDWDNCPNCEGMRDERDDLESEKYDLEQEIVELKDKIEDLENDKEELQNFLLESNGKIQELFKSFNNLETI
jgi:predicted  nucleic acid-binding Zn-ribbon protein